MSGDHSDEGEGSVVEGDVIKGDVIEGDVIEGDVIEGDVIEGDVSIQPEQSSHLDRTMSQSDVLQELLKLTNERSQPNINLLNELARTLPTVFLNQKFYGYELSRQLAAALPSDAPAAPTSIKIECKPSTQEDLEADWTRYWSGQLKAGHVFHRKIWELAYVCQVIWQEGHMRDGARGLGFGVGQEPIPAYLASKGASITMTDLSPEDMHAAGWASTDQHAETIESAYKSDLVDRDVFLNKVDHRWVDMNSIPDDLVGYDFCWSICAFEHVGSIEKGLKFLENSLNTLRSGGVSVHTTEFNFWNDNETIDNWNTVLFQRRHFEEVAERLRAKGHFVAPMNFFVGDKPMDKFIDVPPFAWDWPKHMFENWAQDVNHLKLVVDGFPSTCFGLMIRKA